MSVELYDDNYTDGDNSEGFELEASAPGLELRHDVLPYQDVITASIDGEDVGELIIGWGELNKEDGIIESVHVEDKWQRMGIATAMFREAQRLFPGRVRHDTNVTWHGQQWIRSLGKTAAWKDIVNKAKDIRSAGGVKLLTHDRAIIAAEVRSTSGEKYHPVLKRQAPNSYVISQWECDCDWGHIRHPGNPAIDQKTKNLQGRMCAHAYATLLEAQSSEMFHVPAHKVAWVDRNSLDPGWYVESVSKRTGKTVYLMRHDLKSKATQDYIDRRRYKGQWTKMYEVVGKQLKMFEKKQAATSGKLYHLTDEINFKLNPQFHPQNNTTLGGDWPVPGIFLSDTPEHWLNGYGYWRPWVVEFQVPAGIEGAADYGRETFIPATAFNDIRLVRFIPLDAFCREEYGDWGWTEDYFGTTFDTEESIDGLPRPSNYRYQGDARSTSSDWQKRYKKRVRDFARTRTNSIAKKAAPSRGWKQNIFEEWAKGGMGYRYDNEGNEIPDPDYLKWPYGPKMYFHHHVGKVKDHFAEGWVDGEHHTLSARWDDSRQGPNIGQIQWFVYDGKPSYISLVNVEDGYKRKGLATWLLEEARKITPDLQHSSDLSNEGREWARAVGMKIARGPEEGWYMCSDGEKRWGRFGAAGVLFVWKGEGETFYFLEKRGANVHHGGTWGIPGGAIKEHETPEQGALREVKEEIGFTGSYRVIKEERNEYGRVEETGQPWAYTTVFVEVDEPFQHNANTWESDGGSWFTADEARRLSLHPGVKSLFQKIGKVAPFGLEQVEIEWSASTQQIRASYSGKLIGHLDVSIGGKHDYVDSVWVDPDWRRMGLATLMFERALEEYPELRHSKQRTPDGKGWVKSLPKEHQRSAKPLTITVYHGTNEAALRRIRSEGFKPISPQATCNEIEARYGLPRDSVWSHKYNEFSRGRHSDQYIYFSGYQKTAENYAQLGSEVIFDALNSAWHLLNDPFDEEGNYKPGMYEAKEKWVKEETRKHYKPVVLTCEVPARKWWDDHNAMAKPYRPITLEEAVGHFKASPWSTVMLKGPLPASYIRQVRTAKLADKVLDKKLVDYKPERKLKGKETVRIKDILPASYKSYSETPFFEDLNDLADLDPKGMSGKAYADKREEFFETLPTTNVALDNLVVTQEKVNMSRVKEIQEKPGAGGGRPTHLVRYQGKLYVMNGHHRLVADILSGKRSIPAKVLNMDVAKAAAKLAAGHVELTDKVPLPYDRVHGKMKRLYIQDSEAGQPGTYDTYFKPPHNDDPTLVAFQDLDYTSHDYIFLKYLTVRLDYRGMGLARQLIEDAYRRWPNAKFNWGQLMVQQAATLYRYFLQREPERTMGGTNWYKAPGDLDTERSVFAKARPDGLKIEMTEDDAQLEGATLLSVSATLNGKQVGGVSLFSGWDNGPIWKVWSIGIDDAHRRQGIATAMFEDIRKRYPKHKIYHSGFMSDEGLALAESLPKSWNRIKDWEDKKWRKPRAAGVRPQKGMFAPGKDTLDPRIYDPDTNRMYPAIRDDILALLGGYWDELYPNWRTWAKVYHAGSGASYWWDSDYDLDVLIGIDKERLDKDRPQNAPFSEAEVAGTLTAQLKQDLWPVTTSVSFTHPSSQVVGPFKLQFTVNPNSYDIRKLHPYAAYNITDDLWAVRPVQVPPNWNPDYFPERYWNDFEGEVLVIEDILNRAEAGDPAAIQEGIDHFNYLKSLRQESYSEYGTGWTHFGNFLYQALTQSGHLRRLYLLKHPEERTASGEREGRCYELAGRYVTDHHDAILVHGVVDMPQFNFGRPVIAHAWIELADGRVLDVGIDKTFSKEEHKRLFRPLELVRYDWEEAATKMLQTQHWGPWDDASYRWAKVAASITYREEQEYKGDGYYTHNFYAMETGHQVGILSVTVSENEDVCANCFHYDFYHASSGMDRSPQPCAECGCTSFKGLKEHAVIDFVEVREDKRRQGIATSLFQKAKKAYPTIQHTYLTDQGAAWVKTLGTKQAAPRRKYVQVYHGTTALFRMSILYKGLKPTNRNGNSYVTTDYDVAKKYAEAWTAWAIDTALKERPELQEDDGWNHGLIVGWRVPEEWLVVDDYNEREKNQYMLKGGLTPGKKQPNVMDEIEEFAAMVEDEGRRIRNYAYWIGVTKWAVKKKSYYPKGIPVENLKVDRGGVSGTVRTGGAVWAYRGFGSWRELKDAVRAGVWRSKGMFTVKGEGETQMSWSLDDVLKGSGYHDLRGTGFLAIMEADISGLPFRTYRRITDDYMLAQNPNNRGAFGIYSKDGKSGLLFGNLGLGIGIERGIPWRRIKTIYEVKNGRIAGEWPAWEWEKHIDRVRDVPGWHPEVSDQPLSHRVWMAWKNNRPEAVHQLNRSQEETLCGLDIFDYDSEVEWENAYRPKGDIVTRQVKNERGVPLAPCVRCFPDLKPFLKLFKPQYAAGKGEEKVASYQCGDCGKPNADSTCGKCSLPVHQECAWGCEGCRTNYCSDCANTMDECPECSNVVSVGGF